MLAKIGKRITNNFGLKVLAAVIAILLWLIVVNVEDPNKTQIFSVTVSIENEEYLTSIGKTYEVLDNSDEISFTVSGKRSIVEELTESDFIATANLENIDETMTMIPITITSARYRDQVEITKKSSYIFVAIEDLITNEYSLDVSVEGTPASGCYVASTAVSPEKVSVTGPQSVVDTIDKAMVTVSVEGEDEDLATNSEIILLDENGEPVDTERLELNRTEAAVDVIIEMQKTVPVTYKVSGTPAEGYRYSEVESDMDSVVITGEVSLVELIESIDVSDPQLSVEGKQEDFEVTIHLPDYLPEGISILDEDTLDATVTVHIVGKTTKEIEVPADNIAMNNLDSKWQLAENTDGTYTVELSGFEEDLATIAPSLLTGTVDCASVKEGENELVLVIDGEYGSLAEARVIITIEKTAVPETDESEETAQQDEAKPEDPAPDKAAE